MKCKRLLTVGFMALFCAGTAMAVSRLNSVQLTPKANTATVNLRTVGSYAHKEYRPDEHLMLVDLTGVTADSAVARTSELNSSVLKGYKLSVYTSASGTEVTRIELVLGDNVTAEVNDESDGLKVLLTAGANVAPSSSVSSTVVSAPTSSPSSSVATSPQTAKASAVPPPPSAAKTAQPSPSVATGSTPAYALPVAKNTGSQAVAVNKEASAPRVEQPKERAPEPKTASSSMTPTTIRSISVQRGQGTLDVVIEGPSSVRPFLLKGPDRLVLDFSNVAVTSSVKNITVHTKDVLQVRVGRSQSQPPATRVVIDLTGPRTFDVLSSATQVIIRIKGEGPETVSTPAKAAPASGLVSAEVPVVAGHSNAVNNSEGGHAALASASRMPAEASSQPASSAKTPIVVSAKPASSEVARAALVSVPQKSAEIAPATISVKTSVPAYAIPTKSGSESGSIQPLLASVSQKTSEVAAPVVNGTTSQTSASVKAPVAAMPVKASSVSEAIQPVLSSASQKPAEVAAPPANSNKSQVSASSETPVAATPVKASSTSESVTPVLVSAAQKPAAETPAPPVASAKTVVPALVEAPSPSKPAKPNTSEGTETALASLAVPTEAAVSPSVPAPHPQTVSEPKVRADIAADRMAALPQAGQSRVESARLDFPVQGPATGKSEEPSRAASKYTGEPISVNLKDVDLKDFFRLIHEISGLNIVLDPSVKGTLTLVLDDVPWDQALDIVLKNNELDRELQGNVLRVAARDTLRKEAVDRRAQSEATALAVDRQTITRFLSYAKSKEVVPTLKKFLTSRGDVISDERTNALIISDIPSVLPTLDRLISQLDRKSQEVEIEVRVVSATRSFSRDLGFQLGFNWGNGVSTIGGTNPGSTSTSSTTNTSTGGTTTSSSNNSTQNGTSSSIPLFSNLPVTNPSTGFSISNLTKTYGIDAILTAAESHNLAKVLSRPRVVTQSNVKAEVKQGVKLPVYTAPTNNSNPSVSYIDAVLRLSVTPQITSDNTIFLSVDVENTQPSGTISGNYILTTQQATTQVLVTDGGTVVIGGVIQTTNTVSTTQTPVLGNIPWLGNLFKERSVKTETDELIFFITPKIIQT